MATYWEPMAFLKSIYYFKCERNCLTRLRWAVSGMNGSSLIWRWTSDCFYNCFLLLGFYLWILLSSEVLHKGCPFVGNWGIFLQICHRLLATLWQICYRGKMLLATLWQICNRVSEYNGNPFTSSAEGIGNPLTNYPEGIGNFCK
jgi:hypothetical protein